MYYLFAVDNDYFVTVDRRVFFLDFLPLFLLYFFFCLLSAFRRYAVSVASHRIFFFILFVVVLSAAFFPVAVCFIVWVCTT